jgi:putative membrane protein
MRRLSASCVPIAARFRLMTLSLTLVLGSAASGTAFAASSLSPSDRDFASTVWQRELFEVEASKVAESKASTRAVRDRAVVEEHDQLLVRDKLVWIASESDQHFPADLVADFQTRLDRLNALSGAAFDSAYQREMSAVHALDRAAFSNEAESGQDADMKAFAAEAVPIVDRQAVALHGAVAMQKTGD